MHRDRQENTVHQDIQITAKEMLAVSTVEDVPTKETICEVDLLHTKSTDQLQLDILQGIRLITKEEKPTPGEALVIINMTEVDLNLPGEAHHLQVIISAMK